MMILGVFAQDWTAEALWPGLLISTPLLLTALAGCIAAVYSWSRIRRSLHRLTEERDILHSTIGASGAGFLALDRWGQIVYAGPKLRHIFGLQGTLERLSDFTRAAALSDSQANNLQTYYKAVLRSGTPVQDQMTMATDKRVIQFKARRTGGTAWRGQLIVFSFQDITDETRAAAQNDEQAIRLDKERRELITILDTSPLPIWLYRDDPPKLAYVNQAYANAVGAEDVKTVLRDDIDLLGDDDKSHNIRALAKRTVQKGQIVQDRKSSVIGGHLKTLTLLCQALEFGKVGVAIDSTEQEATRKELARVLASQSDLFDLLSAAVAIFRPDQHLRFYNAAFVTRSGLAADFLDAEPRHEELLQAMHDRRRVPEPADLAAWKQMRVKLFSEITQAEEEIWYLPGDITWRVVCQPEPLGGVMMIIEDVTSDIKLQRSYNTQIAVQRETLNNLREAVSVFGPDGRLKLFNPAMMSLWDLSEDYLRDEPHISDLLEKVRPFLAHNDTDWERLQPILLSAVMARDAQSSRGERADGRVLEWSLVPLPDGRTLLTQADVTEAASYQRALRERNEALETADRLKTEFVANMSYELRTPLNSIIGFTGLMLDGQLTPQGEKAQEYLSYILESAEQLRTLIDSILELALIEAGGMSLDMADFDICDLSDEVIDGLQKQAQVAHLSLVLACDCEMAGQMRGDRRRIIQALQTIITNIMKFTPAGGTICLASARVDTMAEFVIRADGLEMDVKELSAMVRAYTGSVRDAPRGRGSGLGLPLVQSFVKLHGGSITVDSSPHKGTQVTCRLPLKPPASLQE